ncbi:aminotransferase class I/II-fold pyridoxal phosphate-dependent enzyme [Halobacillus sp. K22]|uniref:aminotransferase class I/II-fold pyridoxal phosphate-dependent enzyme n=1 Tax=Halobacillus sp. K22 TaxID=3457431 RepID=UPI003FCC913C
MHDQNQTPLYDALIHHMKQAPFSFHVPGHKFGQVWPDKGQGIFSSILAIDATEIHGLDDLHSPEGVIADAQDLASQYFGSDESFFLVNGSTTGNIAMILSVCQRGDIVIVQRNSHQSVLHGIELAGASPVFISPEFEVETGRYSKLSAESVQHAITMYPDAKAVCLTYPDYFGRTYDLNRVVEICHAHNLPVLVDEAHGVHFQLGPPFPTSALRFGADAVVQSAHKMAPAMTMSSYLHCQGDQFPVFKLKHYLKLLQSSSPSYPLMASLDLARYFLAQQTGDELQSTLSVIHEVRQIFKQATSHWEVKPLSDYDDPLKMTLETKNLTGFDAAAVLESLKIYPELATSKQVLLTFGLSPHMDLELLKHRLNGVDSQLKNKQKHATIKIDQPSFPKIQTLDISYSDLEGSPSEWADWSQAVGYVSAEDVIPYPPGIPLLMKGERISNDHRKQIQSLLAQGARFQNERIESGVRVVKGELS